MRRPSWNKSQAIQQVISLKALLEDRPAAASSASASASALVKNHSPVLPPISAPEDRSPYRRRDPNPIPIRPLVGCDSRGVVIGAEQQQNLHQVPSPSREEQGQMTIIYSGRVNVYSDVPVQKARAIMQLAASPIDLNEPPPGVVHATRVVHSQTDLADYGSNFPISFVGLPELSHTRESEDFPGGYTDCTTGRQASLQRYREKRKERYKGKRIISGPSSSMEMMFLNQKFRGQTPNEQSSWINLNSPTQPRPPCTPTRCSSIENQAQKFRTSFDLNDDGVEAGKR